MNDETTSTREIELAPGVRVDRSLVRMAASRSGGPGGQNVNRRSTKVELRVELEALPITAGARSRLRRLLGPGRRAGEGAAEEALIVSEEHRTQKQNREACLERLRELLVRANTPPKPRKKTKPSRGAVERRLQGKRERSEKKQRRRPPRGE